MPTIAVFVDELHRLLGRTLTIAKFKDLCFDFGIELDSVTSEAEMAGKGEKASTGDTSDALIYKIEVAANRYDLLCTEGIARALRIFLGDMEPPTYVTTRPEITMLVEDQVFDVRPIVVCAVLRNMVFTEHSYKSFIDMQDKLHQTLCRERSLASIGTHDLDTIKPPFRYTALPPNEIVFVPLKCTTAMNGHQLMEHLSKDLKLGRYLNLIRDKPTYPVIYDSNNVVLSLPPIINGEHSKISLHTKNVFIEVTALDLTKAKMVLDTVVTMFSQYCTPQWSVEQVNIVGRNPMVLPDLSPRTQLACVSKINRGLGLNLTADAMLKLLVRMGVPGVATTPDTLSVSVPATRTDILHECDILEDVAISYGFNNLVPQLTPTPTIGSQLPMTKITELLAQEVAMTGFCEVMNFALCLLSDNFASLNRPNNHSAIQILESSSVEFESARTTLLSGLLHTVSNNKTVPLPIRVFEIGDVIIRDETVPVGAKNQLNFAALYCGTTSGFQFIHGLIDRVMLLLNIASKEVAPEATLFYNLEPSADPSFFPKWRADINVNNKKIGSMGVVHPNVTRKFGIDFPCSAVEITLEIPHGL
ncbi:phenylalanyl-tRNA synthetase [Pelomyxa schiedti]|nr:phenylalanyl-tRNA synthetase [Pelomyxa schiedti]